NLLISSEVPIGAGLSSSAALEVAVACALLDLAGEQFARLQIARLCQQAENEFAGMRCGIMDQFASLHGQSGHALLLDCRSLEYEALPLPTDVSIVVCDTRVKHAHASGEYNRRRAECDEAVKALSAALPEVRALRDVSLEQLEQHKALLREIVYRRARHVVSENLRVTAAAHALRAGHLAQFGTLMLESHASLRDDYQVSCAELDVMAALAAKQPGAYGARMSGGGFGGCVVALVDARRCEEFSRQVARDYEQATGLRPEIHICRAAQGAERIEEMPERVAETHPVSHKNWTESPHRRFNPLTQEWVLVSPQRNLRPWQGQVEPKPPEGVPRYDANCYLCPGNARAAGARNPAYEGTHVFDNDFPALLEDSPAGGLEIENLLVAQPEQGVCRVVCFSPRHDLALPRMEPAQIRAVVDAWVAQSKALGAKPWVRHVQIFENRGAMMGASNPHPHCQIWASASLPNVTAREQASFENHSLRHGACLLCRYLELELERGVRVVCRNDSWVAVVPFWALWPFETLLLPLRHTGALEALVDSEREDLADIIRGLTTRYDNLFNAPFPYSMGFHQQPPGAPHPEWHLHAHYFPPLLRSATVQKFMVGYELLATPQRDITPEDAAARMRGASDVHYLSRQEV
ncbi:MAG TPA: UDP-glucose--hexose-1-phosphate uridylyltransferase, partial [Candidatus Acidoferrales bacterium]|nr:UDP-glucose--hexose-1-phosphate uridylyltransferase [Candidatus Acidoferrales bacterium]